MDAENVSTKAKIPKGCVKMPENRPKYHLRFKLSDLLAVVFLVGLHITALTFLIQHITGYNAVSAPIVGLTAIGFAFCSGYLVWRSEIFPQIKNVSKRIALLLLVDVSLIVIAPFLIFLLALPLLLPLFAIGSATVSVMTSANSELEPSCQAESKAGSSNSSFNLV